MAPSRDLLLQVFAYAISPDNMELGKGPLKVVSWLSPILRKIHLRLEVVVFAWDSAVAPTQDILETNVPQSISKRVDTGHSTA